ncbi:MAG: hypothetical protein PUG70_04905 [Lachnospiraceae bacterium]|nr:hypothetical protein [Lachnospiraceae bacterium]MDY5521444.1 hypothetical protein [Agathobacter sp.]
MIIEKYIKSKVNEKIDRMLAKNSDQYGIFDIKPLTHDYERLWTEELTVGNGYYGISTILKKYAGIDQSKVIKAPIEHGINDYENALNPYEIGRPTENIITLSKFRKDTIERLSDKKAIVIGPYIAYAEGHYSDEEISMMHKQNGRTLLVFPTHSTKEIDTSYDVESFIVEIRKLREEFDTVLVCVYWKDIVRGIHKYYEKEGYQIVCAGHIYDINFLKRLRSILELSDAVVFNQTGTGVGYAMQLQKPCYIYSQELNYTMKIPSVIQNQTFSPEHYKIIKEFSRADFQITEQQRKICEYVYGIGQEKTPEQLRQLLLPCLL